MLNLLSLTEVTDREIILLITSSSKEKLFKTLREAITLRSIKIGELISCPKCLGVWTALATFIMLKLELHLLLLCFTSYLGCYLVYLISNKK
jgi:hypothetical protein